MINLLKSFIVPPWVGWLVTAAMAGYLTYSVYDFGVQTERNHWQALDMKKTIANNKNTIALEKQNRQLEKELVAQAGKINSYWKGILDEANTQKQKLIADMRAGNKRLYIATKSNTPTCTGGISIPTTSGSEATTETRAELSEASSQFLVDLTTEADEAIIESNEVKDLLIQCRAHVARLVAQSVGQINN
ncbi:MAG: lysis system i-spanin subunit Rz [Methylophilus sp.]